MKNRVLFQRIAGVMLSAMLAVSAPLGAFAEEGAAAEETVSEETVLEVLQNTDDSYNADDMQEAGGEQDRAMPVEDAAQSEDDADAQQGAQEVLSVSEDGIAEEVVAEESSDVQSEDAERASESEEESLSPETAKKFTNETTKASYLVSQGEMDANLMRALLKIYNKQTNQSVAEGDFNIGHLNAITKVELTAKNTTLIAADLSEIRSVKGVGYAKNMTVLDVSGVPIEAIEASECLALESLTKLVLPDTLKKLGSSAFSGCAGLATIHTVANGTESTANRLPSGLINAAGYNADNCFSRCVALKSITIPSFTEGNEAALQDAGEIFTGCSALTTVKIGAGVSILPTNAFSNCAKAEGAVMTVTFDSGSKLTKINANCFRSTSMKKIDLSNCTMLNEIMDDAFNSDSNPKTVDKAGMCETPLEEVVLPTTLTDLKIGNRVFYRSMIAKLYPKSMAGSFSGTSNAGYVYLPNYISSMGEGVFYEDTKMTKLHLPKNLKEISLCSYEMCSELKTVEADDDSEIETIWDGAFAGTIISDASFMTKLTKLKSLGKHVGGRKSDLSAFKPEMPNGTMEQDKVWKTFASGLTQNYTYVGWQDKKLPIRSEVFGSAVTFSTLQLPASLVRIEDGALWNLTGLTTVKWTTGTKGNCTIGAYAFARDTKLSSVELPSFTANGDLLIEDAAFYYCSALKTVTESGKTANAADNFMPAALASLGSCAFADCKSLTSMSMANRKDGKAPKLGNRCFECCTSLGKTALPNAASVIPERFYYDCPLTTLPGNAAVITELGEGCLFGNHIALIDLSEWKQLTKIGKVAMASAEVDMGRVYASQNGADNLRTKEICLPDKATNSTGRLAIGDGAFRSNANLTTISTKSHKTENEVWIPSYIGNADWGTGVLMETGIEKVKWQYAAETAPQNTSIWTYIPGSSFDGCSNIKAITDVLPAGAYLSKIENIGAAAFQCCDGITQIDLRKANGFSGLKETGNYCFSNCSNVEKVYLPDNGLYTKTSPYMFQYGGNENMASQTKISYVFPITVVDFGTVKELGAGSFASMNTKGFSAEGGKAQYYPWPSKLSEITIPASVTLIGDNCFRGHIGSDTIPGLGKMSFAAGAGGDLTIGKNAFQGDDMLDLSSTPLPDRVVSIGENAFRECTSLGSVVFGTKLRSIEQYAFADTMIVKKDATGKITGLLPKDQSKGLKTVDFSKSINLAGIGNFAFSKSAIEGFDISMTSVNKLNNGVLSACPFLTSVSLPKTMEYVGKNSMNKNKNLAEVKIYATSVLDPEAFASREDYFGYTNIESLNLDIRSEEVMVSLGDGLKPEYFPYNLSLYNKDAVTSMDMHVGKAADTDATIKEYFKIYSKDRYYLFSKDQESNQITDSMYYQQLTDESEYTRKINNSVVMAFKIQGLKPTKEPISFTIENTLSLINQDGLSMTKTFSADFSVVVKNVKFYPQLMQADSTGALENRSDVVTNENTFQSNGESTMNIVNGMKELPIYYQICPTVKESNAVPSDEKMTLVVTTSDPDILDLGGNGAYKKQADGKTDDKTTRLIKAKENSETLAGAVSKQYFSLILKKCGDVTVTAYMQGYPEYKITWKLHVFADVKKSGFAFSVPKELMQKGGFLVGDVIPIIDKITLCGHGTLSRSNNELVKFSKSSNAKLSFTTDHPELISIDAAGNVKVLAISPAVPYVKITATALNSDQSEVTGVYTLNLKYPPLAGGMTFDLEGVNGTIQITKLPAQTGGKAKAKLTKVKKGATSVVIPDVIEVYGVKTVVTAVDKKVFAGNKKLKKVVLGKSVKSLPAGAFKNCSALQSVKLSASLKKVPKNCFEGCKALKSVVIPKTVTQIGKYAFKNCGKLSKVTYQSGSALTTIGTGAFYGCKSIKKMTIPSKKLKTIEPSAFANCKKLKTLVLKTTKLKTVGSGTFKNIKKKAVVKVPKKKKKPITSCLRVRDKK